MTNCKGSRLALVMKLRQSVEQINYFISLYLYYKKLHCSMTNSPSGYLLLYTSVLYYCFRPWWQDSSLFYLENRCLVQVSFEEASSNSSLTSPSLLTPFSWGGTNYPFEISLFLPPFTLDTAKMTGLEQMTKCYMGLGCIDIFSGYACSKSEHVNTKYIC